MGDKKTGCQGQHVPFRTTTSMLGSGGDYETVPVTKCKECGLILEIHTGPDGSYDNDGDAN
jgi:hypothetical protein